MKLPEGLAFSHVHEKLGEEGPSSLEKKVATEFMRLKNEWIKILNLTDNPWKHAYTVQMQSKPWKSNQ